MVTRVALIGFSGAGKSKVGKRLANALDWSFVDTDSYFEEKYRISIPEFFRKYGEDAFRKCEHEVLKEQFDERNRVIACGGGLPCFEDNLSLLLKNCCCVYLKLSPESLYDRLTKSKTVRPLIAQLKPDELLDYIKKMLAIREQFYLQAHIICKGESLSLPDLCNSIQKTIDNYCK